ncbi:MAG TPA: hypothetical protein V6C69_09380 [Trichormus sp.]
MGQIIKTVVRVLILGVVMAVVAALFFHFHMTFNSVDVEKAASRFVEIKLPHGCKWLSSNGNRTTNEVVIEMLEPVNLLIYLTDFSDTKCKDNKELLLRSLKDEMGDKYEPPKSDFTKEVGGQQMLFTEDTNSHKHLLMGALVTNKHDGIVLSAEEVLPSERKKEFEAIDQVLHSIEAWR